jgi:hypothetical protein
LLPQQKAFKKPHQESKKVIKSIIAPTKETQMTAIPIIFHVFISPWDDPELLDVAPADGVALELAVA